jgi:hypothetical protein
MPDHKLERLRLVGAELEVYGTTGAGSGNGVFGVKRKGANIRIVASDDQGGGWEHVSVSTTYRCPTWDEMCFVKDLFWLPTEAVMQLHPPESEYVNNHRFCLHLWRPTRDVIPLPPSVYVGVKSAGTLETEGQARALREKMLAKL